MDKFDAPIWWFESLLFDGWEWLTGSDRKSMRRVILILTLPLLMIGYYGRTALLVSMVLCWSIPWFGWPGKHGEAYLMAPVRFFAAIGVYYGAFGLFTTPWADTPLTHTAAGLVLVCLCLSDYILWADHMNRPRKRRTTLPEHLRELFAGFAPSPRQAEGG